MARGRRIQHGISIELKAASAIPATARERLRLPEDSAAMVEVYEYHRHSWDVEMREETARQLAAAFTEETANA